MQRVFKFLLGLAIGCLLSFEAAAQCPARPPSGTVVQDALSLYPQNGVLAADFDMGYSVDQFGYTHYCYKYQTSTGVVEAPTIRVNQGDELLLKVKDSIPPDSSPSISGMDMSAPAGATCADGGAATLQSTNVHFHGMNVPPTCHQDDVLTTLIQPGSPGFQYKMKIPDDEPPGLYWYHPHVHGFTEFQVNGGAAGALIVEGMEKFRPEVTGLTQRVFVIRQQYLVPWVPGPYELTLNFHLAVAPETPSAPIIEMKPGEKQFWRVANATLQEFLPLQVVSNGVPQPLELIALDGYPLAAPRVQQTILIPPAGRAEFIVQAPPAGGSAQFLSLFYSTGPTGNPDFEQILGNIQVSNSAASSKAQVKPSGGSASISPASLKFSSLSDATVTANRKLYFSEEFGGTNGPIQFYITVDGQKQKVFEPNEKPVITTKVGAVEDWTIENRALETHAFHIHQIHFMMLEVDGKPVKNQDLRDTIEIPYWSGKGPYHSVKVRMDFRDPTIAGTFVFHCHILLHEDMGMMHKILVEP
ncbi:MAG TPA: multicopper oxidase domain-containing protein [Candidatus Aquilonibacter sp.]|nr:multicopper oxidase domain-containing protein [Candidatus Aquilonibacter sp.]